MQRLRDLSIRSKLTAIMMLTTGIVLALASGGLVVSETIRFRRAMLQELEVLADITARNSLSALTFNDAVAARETLSALRSKPGIVVARVLTPAGGVFATYAEPSRPDTVVQTSGENVSEVDLARALKDGGYHEWGQRLVLVRRMTLDGDVIGFVQMESSLDELNATIRNLLRSEERRVG